MEMPTSEPFGLVVVRHADMEGCMRKSIVWVLAVVLCASPAMAQSSESTGTKKLWLGIGALALGAVVTAKASDTSSATSSLSQSQLWTGLAIVGVGGFLVWNGLQDRQSSSPSTTFGISAGKQAGGLFVQRRW
jgi:hypothetical protein